MAIKTIIKNKLSITTYFYSIVSARQMYFISIIGKLIKLYCRFCPITTQPTINSGFRIINQQIFGAFQRPRNCLNDPRYSERVTIDTV
ncbi:hypothetical protein SBF1_7340002 [Candidatus Desulfosporosinus infrequens]|uniref:Uncharacterized protein n=1 Tax=Candidatus Desulfosporosinus infrequens TaxID=2043169 RepID=A0A2U3LQD5_9FIRM|nr:hypothetical protein SBF1_7340002 [Candidatus Desulfosporosinus infrequens]